MAEIDQWRLKFSEYDLRFKEFSSYEFQYKTIQDETIKKDLLIKQKSDELDALRLKLATLETYQSKISYYEDEQKRISEQLYAK